MPNDNRELLPIVVQENNHLVDARLLHSRLKSGHKFSDWIKLRISEFGFEQTKDYLISENCETKTGRGGDRRSVNYLLTLDMAKELAMVERNETGRAIRRYFIEKEKELRGLVALPPVAGLFRGLRPKTINDRRMYPYQAILQRCGYSTRASSSQRRARYWQHFVKNGSLLFITEELALHLHQQRQVMQNRVKLKEMHPVLPLDFGTSSLTIKPIYHA